METKFRESIDKAVHNPNLTGALGRFSEAYRISRQKAYEGYDFEALRTQIAERKSYAASHLDELADLFTRNIEARGTKVFRTNDPAQVREYILNVARENGVKSVVKSKSMASEEIHLNRHLEAAGIEVGETDLGEWIIQLAGQTPSHMVMPAIHMTKEEVATVFNQQVEAGQKPDIPQLVKFARGKLRTKFLNADMGITGANIAVAETGTLVIVTNEGNARLVTTLPKIHVAIVGLEKLMEKFDDVVPVLTALPKSATAQLMTSYVSMISGPVPNTDGTPKQLHVILMDNRRTEMSQDPKFKQAMQCIRCASCLNVCPVFRLVGGHVFGKIYTGGIGTILTAWFDALKASDDIQSLCIQCGNCTEVCPGKIDIPGLILELRRRIAVEKGQPLAQKAIFSVVNNRKLFHSMLRAAYVMQKPLQKGNFIRHLPFFLSEMTEFRSLPAIAEAPLRDTIRKIPQPAGKEKIAFYAGCLIDFAYPEMGESLVKILNKAGIEVLFPEGQTCCGAPARYAGAYEVAAQNAQDNINALLAEDVTYVVSACPTCTVQLKARVHQHVRKPRPDRCVAASAAVGRKGDRLLHPRQATGGRRPTEVQGRAAVGEDYLSRLLPLKAHAACYSTTAATAHPGRLRDRGNVRGRHVLRHGRDLFAQVAGNFGPDPGTQAGQHQEQWCAGRCNGLSRLRHADPRRPG